MPPETDIHPSPRTVKIAGRAAAFSTAGALAQSRHVTRDPMWLRVLLTTIALLFLLGFLFVPLAAVFAEALRGGVGMYLAAFSSPDARAAIRLTLLVTAICIPANTAFGIAAAWAVTKHDFRGKSLLLALLDLPFAVSPVVAGLVFVLVFGRHGWLGPANLEILFAPVAPAFGAFVDSCGLRGTFLGPLAEWLAEPSLLPVLFSPPGIVLATIFVSCPFVARELIPLMQAQGADEELAALSLGASGWRTFWHVTLPNIKWALFYGVVLCGARAMGEFGAVSVISGKIRGETNTLPLHVEILFNEYNSVGAFAVASLLALLALVSLALKTFAEWRFKKEAM
ncbi:MAG: sulfate ABC transporter permease subunit CysW [Puniceicoccales bacterium]|nr:sulfate ABC transporter permease subunit CysW [Puniceicoccales bacterium]